MTRRYTMEAVRGAAERAVALVRGHLEGQDPGSRIHDVQSDPRCQARGVDLLWERSSRELVSVEVKGDRQAGRRDTFFLELVSNLERDTPGCFLYSAADLLAYVALDTLELSLMPLPAARTWFLARASEFPLRQTQTAVGRESYTTVGAVVPRRTLVKAIPEAASVKLAGMPLRTTG